MIITSKKVILFMTSIFINNTSECIIKAFLQQEYAVNDLLIAVSRIMKPLIQILSIEIWKCLLFDHLKE